MKKESVKILIIEDDIDHLQNIKDFLEEEGYTIKTAFDGEEGIEAAKEYLPDIIISDISMPKKDGYEVLKALSNNSQTKDIPFIFLTAKVERDDIRKGMNLGAADYIFKPFSIDDLVTSIELRLARKRDTEPEVVEEKKKIENYEYNENVLFEIANKMQFYSIKSIKYIRAEKPYVNIKFIDGKSSLQRQSLENWESKLPVNNFLRIHRTTIINIEYITKIEKLSKISYILKIKDESDPFVISKRYSSKLKKRLNK